MDMSVRQWVVLLTFIFSLWQTASPSISQRIVPTNTPMPKAALLGTSDEQATVLRVVDGDTIVLSDNRKVRLIGINAPELSAFGHPAACYAEEAKQFLQSQLTGKTIHLRKEVSETDKYGRLLRDVYLDTTFINAQLVDNGYAKAVVYKPDITNKDLLAQKEETAKIHKLGMWGQCSQLP